MRRDDDWMITEYIMMRPILTGPTDGSNLDHGIAGLEADVGGRHTEISLVKCVERK